MSSNSQLSSALAALSINSSSLFDEPACGPTSLTHLPKEVISGIADCLCHESLTNLGATSSPLRLLVKHDIGNHWKVLHDKRWSSWKQVRFLGPPSQRPRDGRVTAGEGISDWREEFIRRYVLDKSVEGRLRQAMVEYGDPTGEAFTSLVKDGEDILDQLKRLSKKNNEYTATVEKVLVHKNKCEAHSDWLVLHSWF